MLACFFRYFILLLGLTYLCGCTTTHALSHHDQWPAYYKNKGLIALSITCQGIAAGTRNKLLLQEARVSVIGRMFSADTVSAIPFSCNESTPSYALQSLPAGVYRFTGLTLGHTRALFNLTFSVVAHQITYIGRLTIIATQPISMETVTFNTVNPGVIQFKLTHQAAVDMAYFKHAYPNMDSSLMDVAK